MLKDKDCDVTGFTDHVKQTDHFSKLLHAQNNSLLLDVSNLIETNHMYRAPPSFHNVPNSKSSTIVQPSVHMKDWKTNMAAMLVSLLPEKSLLITITVKSIFDRCFIVVFLNTILVGR